MICELNQSSCTLFFTCSRHSGIVQKASPNTEQLLQAKEVPVVKVFRQGGVFLGLWQNTFLAYLGISPDALRH